MKTKPETLRTWAAALRQRADRQIQSYLAQDVPGRGRCFCAVGALLDTRPEIEWQPYANRGIDPGVFQPSTYQFRHFPALLGIDEDLLLDVIDMNDDKNMTFEQIASELERQADLPINHITVRQA